MEADNARLYCFRNRKLRGLWRREYRGRLYPGRVFLLSSSNCSRSCRRSNIFYWIVWSRAVHHTSAGKGNRDSEGHRCECLRANVIDRKEFFITRCAFTAHRIPGGLVRDEPVAEQLCLQGTNGRVDILTARLGAVFIALITVSYQSFHVALANPVKSLRAQ